MPLISGTIPSLINGVSQQPATLRLPTQGETQVNGLSHIARGLEKRPCTEHITEVSGVTSSNSDDVFIHTIRRSEDEAYAMVIKGGSTNGTNGATSNVDASVNLIDLTGYATGVAGEEVFIRSAETTGNITGSHSFSSLTCTGATSNTITATGHKLINGDIVQFTTSATTLPAGLNLLTPYYVKTSNISGGTFEVSTSSGGTTVNITDTGTGTGTHKVQSFTDIQSYLSNFGSDEVFKPNKLSATTIADFTFLLNKTKVVEQDTTVTTEDRDYESLVYFKIGDYGADYKINIKEFNVYTAAWNEANPTDTGALGEMNNSSLRQEWSFQFRTPDNKVKSQIGKGTSGNNESLNNQQTVAVSNIAFSLFWGDEKTKIVKCDLNVGSGTDDPATINVSGAQTVTNAPGASSATTALLDEAVYTGDMAVLGKGTYTSSTANGRDETSTSPTTGNVLSTAYQIGEGLQGFSNTHSGTAGPGEKHPNFSISNASGADLGGDESIIHIKNNQYPFTVEVTDGKGDSYMRALNGHDEVAQFGYLPGSKVPSGFIAKVSGDRSSGQDDYYVAWKDGVWKETTKPVYPGGTTDHSHAELLVEARTTIKSTTMPIQLFKNFGTVNGVADQIYFVLSIVDWGVREKGDSGTNPFPSFANYDGAAVYTINDIFFHRNRLGFVSDENVILSEVGSYFNFFHTTVLSVLDTAVIDVAVSNNQVAILKSAIPFQESLILFSDLQQFKLTSDQFLTPTSVTVDVSTNFETSTDTKPVAAGKTIFFPFQRGAYSGIREYFIDVASETNDANEISAHVPEYIDGVVKKLAVSSNEEVLIVLSSTNRKEVGVYKYYYNDKEKLQSAWSKWTFDADVIDVAFVGSVAFILFRRGDGASDKVYLEKLNLSVDSATAVEDDKIGIRLDRRVKLTNESLLTDSTPVPSAAWQLSQSLTAVATTANVSGSGTGRTFSITTDSSGTPTVFTTALGTGYVAGNVIRLTDPHVSGSNTADVTISTLTPYLDVDWDKVTDTSVRVKTTVADATVFGPKIPIDGLDTGGNFSPRIGQTFTVTGAAGQTYEVIDTEEPDATNAAQIVITPSVSKDNPWADNTVLVFNERKFNYVVETGEKLSEVKAAKGLSGTLAEIASSYLVKGTELSIQRGNTQPVIYAGIPYKFEYQFSEQFLKNNDNSINSGRLQMRNFEIYYDKTGYFRVKVSPKPHDSLYRDVTTSEFTGVIVGSSLLGNKSLDTGVFRVPVYVNSKDVKITVTSDSWYPVALQSADWEAMQVLRSQRI